MSIVSKLFGGEKASVIGNAVNSSQSAAQQTMETQKKLDEDRAIHMRIDDGFFQLMTDPEIAQKSRAAAAANEAKLDKMKASVDAMNEAGGEKEVIFKI